MSDVRHVAVPVPDGVEIDLIGVPSITLEYTKLDKVFDVIEAADALLIAMKEEQRGYISD